MKYRIVLREDGYYRVQYRSWWYWWITDDVYKLQDEEHDDHRKQYWTQDQAKLRIKVLKTIEQLRREKKPKKQEVVYTDP